LLKEAGFQGSARGEHGDRARLAVFGKLDHRGVRDMDDFRCRCRRKLPIPVMRRVARHCDVANLHLVQGGDCTKEHVQRGVRALKYGPRPVGKMWQAHEYERNMPGIICGRREQRQLSVEIRRRQRPHATDHAKACLERHHEIALVSGLAAVLSSVSMLASASRRGTIAAVLAVTVQTLESAMKVSDTASTATKRANAASKG